MPTNPSNPLFKATDKIILDFTKYNSTNGTRGVTHQSPIAYIVTGYRSQTATYYVVLPNGTNHALYSQFDLETRFRLATAYEIERYFK